MRAYIATTGIVFGLVTLSHLARSVELWHRLSRDPWYVVGMCLLSLSEHVRGHVGQLDVGGLQYFQETVALRRLTFHQLTTIAHQVAEFADGLRRNEAGTEQPVAEQVRDPFRILHIGLTPGHLLDVLRVGHHNLQGSFQYGVDRLPVDSRAFHSHMGAAFREQPCAQTDQLSRGSAERSHFLLNLSVLADDQQAGHYCGLMYVQSTTAFDQSLHNASLGGDCCAAGLLQTLSCVLPVSGYDKRWYLYRRGSVSSAGSVSSHRLPTFKQSPTTNACITETDPSPRG